MKGPRGRLILSEVPQPQHQVPWAKFGGRRRACRSGGPDSTVFPPEPGLRRGGVDFRICFLRNKLCQHGHRPWIFGASIESPRRAWRPAGTGGYAPPCRTPARHRTHGRAPDQRASGANSPAAGLSRPAARVWPPQPTAGLDVIEFSLSEKICRNRGRTLCTPPAVPSPSACCQGSPRESRSGAEPVAQPGRVRLKTVEIGRSPAAVHPGASPGARERCAFLRRRAKPADTG